MLSITVSNKGKMKKRRLMMGGSGKDKRDCVLVLRKG